MRDISRVLHSKPPKRNQIVDFVDMIQASWEMSGLKPFEGKGDWEASMRASEAMFLEAGIQTIRLDEKYRRVSFSGSVV